MDENVRIAILTVGAVFLVIFGGMTLAVVAETGFDILTLSALVILALVLFGLIGAIRTPPE